MGKIIVSTLLMTQEPNITETQDAPWEEAEATNAPKNAQEKRGRGQKKDGERSKSGKKRDKPPRRNKYEEWEKEITITLDTPIPEMPKEKLAEPNSDDLRKALKDVHAEIETSKNKIEKLKDDRAKAIDEDRKERAKNQGDLEKLAFQKEGLVKQCFGKKLMKAEECNNRIDELDYRQKTEKLTATEERAILKDLSELKHSLPIIEKVDVLDKKMKEAKEQKK